MKNRILSVIALATISVAPLKAATLLTNSTPWYYGGGASNSLSQNTGTGVLTWNQGNNGGNNMIWVYFPTTTALETTGGSVSFTFTLTTDSVPRINGSPFRVGLFYDNGNTQLTANQSAITNAAWTNYEGIAAFSTSTVGSGNGTTGVERIPNNTNTGLWSSGAGAFTSTFGAATANPNLTTNSVYNGSLTLTNTGAGIQVNYVLGSTSATWTDTSGNIGALNMVSIFSGGQATNPSNVLTLSNLQVTAVPEPATAAFVALGGMLVFFGRRRFRLIGE